MSSRHLVGSLDGYTRVLPRFPRKLAPLASAGGASFPIAYPHRGDAVPGAARVSAVASGFHRQHGAAVLVPGAADSLGRIPAPVGGPRGPEFSLFIGRLRVVAEAEDGRWMSAKTGRKEP